MPLVAGVLVPVRQAPSGARWIALIATLLDLALSIYLWAHYDPDGAQWQFVEKRRRSAAAINWALGHRRHRAVLIVLTAFLMPICIGASWRSIEKRVPEYMAYFLLMEALIIGSSRRRTCSCSTSSSKAA